MTEKEVAIYRKIQEEYPQYEITPRFLKDAPNWKVKKEEYADTKDCPPRHFLKEILQAKKKRINIADIGSLNCQLIIQFVEQLVKQQENIFSWELDKLVEKININCIDMNLGWSEVDEKQLHKVVLNKSASPLSKKIAERIKWEQRAFPDIPLRSGGYDVVFDHFGALYYFKDPLFAILYLTKIMSKGSFLFWHMIDACSSATFVSEPDIQVTKGSEYFLKMAGFERIRYSGGDMFRYNPDRKGKRELERIRRNCALDEPRKYIAKRPDALPEIVLRMAMKGKL